jgi:CheY-like chemotaxis protein
MNILIADDSSTVRRLIQDACQGLSWNHTILTAGDGAEAHEQLLRMRTGLAFLDVHMPGMSGLEALALARQAGNRIAAVVISSSTQDKLREIALQLGAFAYLRKPFTAGQITGLIAQAEHHMTGQNVLVVDDSATVRKALSRMAAALGAGHDVYEAPDAETAIRLTRSALFDTVLLDVNMPGMNGLEAIPLLKAADPKTRIIIVTGEARPEIVVEAKQRGAGGFLVKPVRQEHFNRAMGALAA